MKIITFSKITTVFIATVFLGGSVVSAQLIVSTTPLKIEGNKAVLKINLKNSFTNSIQSARATVFILNENQKAIAQETRWIIGGMKAKSSLAAGGTNTFFFVVTSDKAFGTTNLTAKAILNRIVLNDGTLIVPSQNVEKQR